MSFAFLVTLSTIAIPWASAASHLFLARQQADANSELALATARERLRGRAFDLCRAVGEELLGTSSTWDIPLFVVAARGRLGEETDRLQNGNSSEAKLLHDFVRRAPSHVFLWPVLSSEPDWELATSLDNGNISSISTQVVTETNDKGETVTHTVRCENDKCTRSDHADPSAPDFTVSQTIVQDGRVERTTKHCRNGKCETSKEEEDAEEPAMVSKVHLSRDGGEASQQSGDMAETSMRDSMRKMAKEMQDVENNFGIDIFDSAFDVFAEPHALRNKRDANGLWGGFFNNILARSNETAAESSASDSSVSQIVVKDGHVIRTTTHCRNGECDTSKQEGDIDRGEPGAQLKQAPDIKPKPGRVAELENSLDSLRDELKRKSEQAPHRSHYDRI